VVNKKKKPAFKRWMSDSYARLSESWRHPRGRHSKVRRREKGKVKMPFIGWGAKASDRNLHPSGFREVMVHSASDLKNLDVKTQAIRIGATVGNRKRIELLKTAEQMSIKVLNPGKKLESKKA
jgi:large subunit ribosomal protein L32e